jgi:hypothetical protein
MSIGLTSLSESDFKSRVSGRVKVGMFTSPIIIREKEVEFSLAFNEILFYNSTGISIADLEFHNCVFKEPVVIETRDKAGNVKFVDCIFEQSAEIISYLNVRFLGHCVFRTDLQLAIDKSVAPIRNMSVDGTLYVKGFEVGSLLIKDINSNGRARKSRMVIEIESDHLQIQNSSFHNLEITANSSIKKDTLIDGMTSTQFTFSGSDGELLQITNSKIETLTISNDGLAGQCLMLSENEIAKELNLPLEAFVKSEISKSNINAIKISGFLKKEQSALLQELTLDWLLLDNISNEGMINIIDVTIPQNGLLEIRSSNLGKTDFILCNFKKANFKFQNSKLTEIFIVETEFPRRVFSNGKVNHRQAQLAFGQISTAFQKQGDTVRSLEYQAREIEAHYMQLLLYDNEEKRLSFTKISLWLNKWSNDFGRSWQRGMLFSIVAGIIFFYLLVVSSKSYHFGFPISFDVRLFVSFLRFMNPLRFFELESIFKLGAAMPFLHLSEWSYLWDFLGRVFVAYGFYQTIQAFRRYGRKT